jgi:hypothetical protein
MDGLRENVEIFATLLLLLLLLLLMHCELIRECWKFSKPVKLPSSKEKREAFVRHKLMLRC